MHFNPAQQYESVDTATATAGDRRWNDDDDDDNLQKK